MASKPLQTDDDISPIPMDQDLATDDAPPADAPPADSVDSEEPAPTAPARANTDHDATLTAASAPVPAPASSQPTDAVRPGRSVRGGNMEMRVLSRAMQDLDVLTGGTRAATYDEVDTYVSRAILTERQLELAARAALSSPSPNADASTDALAPDTGIVARIDSPSPWSVGSPAMPAGRQAAQFDADTVTGSAPRGFDGELPRPPGPGDGQADDRIGKPMVFADGLPLSDDLHQNARWDLPPPPFRVQNRARRVNIISTAEKLVDSTAWADQVANGRYGAGTNKCNKFVADVLTKAGASPGMPNGFWNKYPPTAGQWADPDYVIPGWRIVKNPQPGDVVAQKIPYSDASGHVMIVGRNGTVIGTGEHGHGPHGTIEHIPMPGALGPNPGGPMVFRRWVGQ